MQSKRKKIKMTGNYWSRKWTRNRENQEGENLVF